MNQPSLSPLSLIAIFAGVVEASALASLPFLNDSSQSIYTWFLVAFPFFLTMLFFLTLNFNSSSLFSPEKADLAPHQASFSTSEPAPATSWGQLPTANSGPIIVALSGPKSRATLEQHLRSALDPPHSTVRNWVLYDLDQRTCITLSVGPMQDNAHAPFNSS
ncbi:hypothetical protein [Pseudomonas fakonensis]|nr:hypothetical protein [Pseudomonas fakonensis]